MNSTDDTIREIVLTYFYTLSKRDPHLWVSALSVIRNNASVPREQILGAIEFLSDERYLKIQKNKSRSQYKISVKGLEYFSPSKFTSKHVSPISVTAQGGIFVFGDNLGTIKQETVQSFDEITQLIKIILQSNLSDAKKREQIGDAETIKAQLTKPKPDPTIIQKAWESMQLLVSLKDAIDVMKTVGELLRPYIAR